MSTQALPTEERDRAQPAMESFEGIEEVPLTLCAELDRRKIPFRDLVELGVGSIVAFPRPSGENVDLYAEDVLIGTGEILIVDSRLAVRVSDIRDREGGGAHTDPNGDTPNGKQ